jgi:RNA polymerase sigma-70 factor (ECF subfamily)
MGRGYVGTGREGCIASADSRRLSPVSATPDVAYDEAPPEAIERQLETHRRELTGYCYRMLGSGFEAEDAVQETMVRAWRGIDKFEGRSAVRSWLYRIATNVCLDMLRGPQRRARPMDLGPASTAESHLAPGIAEHMWVQPVPDAWVVTDTGDPAELAASRETIRLAFVAALQLLPPRQRAVLILREVLRWHSIEVAELLDTSVASVNSSLQRARSTLAANDADAPQPTRVDTDQEDLLARYVDAFERYDVDSLVSILHEDVIQSMPPYALWLRGPQEVINWQLGQGAGCRGSRLVATSANGCAAFGSYRPAGPGVHEPFAIQVIEVSEGRISGLHNFLYPELFAAFGLPSRLES